MKPTWTRPLVIVSFFALCLLVIGCGGEKQTTDQSNPAVREDPNVREDLHLLMSVYMMYGDIHGRGPRGIEDLREYIHTPKLKRAFMALQAGNYVFIWNYRMMDAAVAGERLENLVLGYEKDTPTTGGHVLLADGHVTTMPAEEFNKAPKFKAK